MPEKRMKPVIRFEGYNETWEQRKFSEIYSYMQNNTLSRAELVSKNGVALNVHYGDLLVKIGECLDVENTELPLVRDAILLAKYKASLLKDGDIIMADTAEDETVGKCCEIEGLGEKKALSGLHTIPCRPNWKFASGYLGYYMNSPSYHNQLIPLMQGIKVTAISKTAIQDTVVKYPLEEQEQKQVGSFFKQLDKLIKLHEHKYDNLRNVKKAMLQKMFPQKGQKLPKIRFNGFKDDWKIRPFGEIVDNFENPVATPHSGYMRLGIRSYAKGTFHSFVEEGKALESAQMHKVVANNFIVNITFGWEHAVAITDEEDEGKLVSHRFPQFSFHEGMVPQFFKYVILDERFRYHLWLSSPGGAGRNKVLKIDEMLEYKMTFPSEKEQRKIAEFFEKLDNIISIQQEELEKLKRLKTAFLDKMFV